MNIDGTGSHGTKGKLHKRDATALRARGFKIRDDNMVEWIELAGDRIRLDGEDVTEAIRDPAVAAAASRVSIHPGVREAMVQRQRALIAAGDYVAEGRDIGTVVSPEAPLKVFLTASEEERAHRRAAELGEPAAEVRQAQAARDARDRGREHGALRAAADAVEVDTTGLDVDAVVERIAKLARRRGLMRG